jgi:hypothetical protein
MVGKREKGVGKDGIRGGIHTTSFLSQFKDTLKTRVLTITPVTLLPLSQLQALNHEFAQILRVRKRDDFLAVVTRQRSDFVRHVDEDDEGGEVGGDVRHAVVV